MATLGDRIRSARILRGFTQEQLAEALGVARPTITQYESGRREPDNVDLLDRLADILSVSVDWLIGRTEDPGPQADELDPDTRILMRAMKGRTEEQIQAVLAFIKYLDERDAEEAKKQNPQQGRAVAKTPDKRDSSGAS